jgi:hypothetical protein
MHTKVALISVTNNVSSELRLTGSLKQDLQPGCEAVDVSGRIGTAPGTSNGREADEDWGLLASGAQERRGSQVAPVSIAGEGAVSSRTSRMDRPFGNLGRW